MVEERYPVITGPGPEDGGSAAAGVTARKGAVSSMGLPTFAVTKLSWAPTRRVLKTIAIRLSRPPQPLESSVIAIVSQVSQIPPQPGVTGTDSAS